MFDHNMAAGKAVRFRKSLLAISIMALGAPSLGHAQANAQANVQKTDEVDEIVVQGLRASLESAQDIKRNADTVKDVVTASDIGALPDKSVTEALQRVPGVTVGRFASAGDPNHFASEGRGVLVRGLDRVHSQFNGRESFSAGNWSSGLSFEDVPPELLGSVEVVKNQTSDIISGGIAGTVNLVTRKPFDSPGRKVSVSIKDSYGDLVDKWSPAFSGLYSDRWETSAGEFGALLSASTSKFYARGDGINLTNFYERSATQTEFPGMGSTAIPGHENEKLYVPVGAWLRTSDSDRDRKGYDASLQWQNTDETLKATAEFIKSDSHESWHEHVLIPTDDSQGFQPEFTNPVLVPGKPATFDSNGYFTSGTISYPWNTAFLTSSRGDNIKSIVEDSSFKFELTPNDKLKIKLDAQHINTTYERQNNSINNRFSQSDVYLDLRGSTPKVEFLGTNTTSQPADWMACPAGANPGTTSLADPMGSCNYYQVSIMDTNMDAEGTMNAFTADVQYQIDGNWFKSVSGGVFVSDTNRTTQDDDYANWGNVSNTWGTLPKSGLAEHPELYEAFTFDGDFFGGKGLVGNNRTFLFPKMSTTEEANLRAYDKFLKDNGINNSDRVNRYDRTTIDGKPTDSKGYLPTETYKTAISRQEEYVRFDFANDELAFPIKANMGLRYVSYEVEATGASKYPDPFYRADPTAPDSPSRAYFLQHYPAYATFFNNDGSTFDTAKPDTYTTTLPSFNLSVSLTDDLIARLAFSKAIYFPSLYDIRNTKSYTASVTTITDPNTQQVTSQTASASGVGGNPKLTPEESNQLDLTAEWYFNKVGSLTFSAFHKNISNIFRERNYLETVTNPSTNTSLDMLVRRQVNEGEGTVQGFEIAYQQFYDFLPGAWSGLGMQLNYTYVDQKDLGDDKTGTNVSIGGDRNTFRNFTNLPLPGLSKDTINAVAMYQYAGIEARIAYNWRSKYLITRRDADAFSPIYDEAQGYMDASLWYSINDNVKVGIEGSNLLNEMTRTLSQVNAEGDTTGKTYSLTDRRYAVSMRITF